MKENKFQLIHRNSKVTIDNITMNLMSRFFLARIDMKNRNARRETKSRFVCYSIL